MPLGAYPALHTILFGVNVMKKFSLLTITLFLTACSLQPSEKLETDPTAQGVLDYSNNLIILPLDEYLYTEQDMLSYQKAFDIIYGSCFAAKGKTYSPQDYTPIGSRPYGLWNLEQAQKYGFGTASESVEQAPNDPVTMSSCEPEAKALKGLSPIDSPHQELLADIGSTAYSAAQNDPLWTSEREEWWACLAENGLTPRKGEHEWGSEQGNKTFSEQELEESIRIATIEASCSEKTGLAQTLANLEASYQAPLISKNQADLNEAKNHLQRQREKLSDFLSKHQ